MTLDVLALPKCESSKCERCQVQETQPVDIVAVHGLNETSSTAWTDPETNILWLRDLLPQDLHQARILSFGYRADASSFFAGNGSEVVDGIAETLVQNLESHRALDGGQERPIIFVCHGLGGVVVKKALIYSSTRTSAYVEHLYSIYVSTFAILLFGVPHNNLSKSKWLELESILQPSQTSLDVRASARVDSGAFETGALRVVEGAFASLMKQFRIYYFWESIETSFGNSRSFVVDQASAAPAIDNTERMGIPSDHSTMVKYVGSDCKTYRTVLGTLIRYCREAPSLIANRWKSAEQNMSRARSNEAFELTGVVYDIDDLQRRTSRSRSAEGGEAARKHIDLPRRPLTHYVGRSGISEDLEKAFFSTSESSQKVFVLYGMGGTGKTEISIKFARDNQHRFSAVFTVQAIDAEHVKESYAKIGSYGGLESTERSGKYWLAQAEEPWLLLIDNADDPSTDLTSLFPLGDHGSILVTTRNPQFRKHNTIGCRHVGGLNKEEALSLLLTSANIQGPPWQPALQSSGNGITEALGYLALAVKVAGASIYRNVCSLQEYLDFHADFRNRYHDPADTDRQSKENEASVYSVFEIPHRWLGNQGTRVNRDALELLNIVAFYHFEHIRIEIFNRANTHRLQNLPVARGQSFLEKVSNFIVLRLSPPRALPGFLKQGVSSSPWRIREALARLSSLSMIFYDGQGDSFSLHPLVHAWIRDRMSTSNKVLWACIAFNILADSIRLPSANETENPGKYHRDILPHLDVCLTKSLRVETGSSMLEATRTGFAMILQPTLLFMVQGHALDNAKCGYVYLTCGRFDEATIYLSAVCEALLQILGPKNERTMKAQLGLAQAFWGLGQLNEAIKLQSLVVEARKGLYGAVHSETLLAMDHLGRSLWLNGRYTDALHLQQHTVQTMKTQLPAGDSRLLAASDNLGIILGAWHRFDESLSLHQEVLRLRQRNRGSSDAELISTKMYMAMALLDVGRLQEAQNEMVEVYQARRSHLGKEHPWTLWAVCYLAKTYVRMGKLEKAEGMLLEGIAAGKRSLTDDHLGVLMGCGELARVYSRQGRLGEACSLLGETVELIKRSGREDQPDYIEALWGMAKLYRKQERYKEGAEICELALEKAQYKLTLDHPLSRLIAAERDELETIQMETLNYTMSGAAKGGLMPKDLCEPLSPGMTRIRASKRALTR